MSPKFKKEKLMNAKDVVNIEKMKDIIRSNFNNSFLGVELLAESFGISVSYLREKMMIHHQMTPQQLIEAVRLETAIYLIATQNCCLDIIGKQVGYLYTKTFRSAFKKRLQITPSEFKKRLSSSTDADKTMQVFYQKLWYNRHSLSK